MPAFQTEIEQRLKASAQFTDGIWRWHTQRWGDLDVLVLPRSINKFIGSGPRSTTVRRVADSNTGIVIAGLKHAYLLGNVVVSDGARVACDVRALNHLINGDASAEWDSAGLHAYAVPNDFGCSASPADFERASIAVHKESPSLDHSQIRAQVEFMLGWGAFSIQCVKCRVLVPCGSVQRVVSEAKRYDFKVVRRESLRPICRRCAGDPDTGPIMGWPTQL